VSPYFEPVAFDIKVAYLENYNMKLGAMITSGVDLWLNTPEPPMEASGTSGIQAALNGIPNLSVFGAEADGNEPFTRSWNGRMRPCIAPSKPDATGLRWVTRG
jgi:hypothetical protein